MKKPNIFEFATSEFSQDAFLCYLLTYGKKEYENTYPNEYEIGNKFLNVVLKECFKDELIPEIETLEIQKQVNHIDILLVLNEKKDPHYIIIEDKIDTSEHSNQIQRYKESLIKKIGDISEEKIKTLYLKTGDESLYELEKSPFKKNRIMRKRLLEIYYDSNGKTLYKGNNCIIIEYFEKLKQTDNDVESFRAVDLKEKEFSGNQMTGFYNALDKEFYNCEELNKIYGADEKIHSNWDYVANQNGGFLCYHFWGLLNYEKYSYYLQIEKINIKSKEEEQSRNTKWSCEEVPYSSMTLVIKVWSNNKNIDILRKSLEILKEKYPEKFKEQLFLKPNKFSSGSWMTLLLINDYIILNADNTINVEKTCGKILEYNKLLKSLEKDLVGLEN